MEATFFQSIFFDLKTGTVLKFKGWSQFNVAKL